VPLGESTFSIVAVVTCKGLRAERKSLKMSEHEARVFCFGPCGLEATWRLRNTIGGTMRMFVLLSRYQKPLVEVNRSLPQHSQWVQRQYESGRFLVSGRREPPIGGIIVARASSEQELREVLTTDPFQQKGLAEYEVFAFDATDFPKRSSAFDTFASKPLGEPHGVGDGGPHAHK